MFVIVPSSVTFVYASAVKAAFADGITPLVLWPGPHSQATDSTQSCHPIYSSSSFAINIAFLRCTFLSSLVCCLVSYLSFYIRFLFFTLL